MKSILILPFIVFGTFVNAQTRIEADRIFDGNEIHEGWVVVIDQDKIVAVGPSASIKIKAKETILLPGTTLMPGMIEGHSHMLLYPYNQTNWNDQVLKESESYRVLRASVHAKNTLLAGVTTSRDLGSEGAGYADVGLKRAIDDGLIPGPRLLVAGPAIVATGAYGPKGFSTEIDIHKGAEEADGNELRQVVRNQIGRGADFIKVYADYRWGANGEARPTFSLEELTTIVETAKLSGRYVVAHASSDEAIRLAVLAGVETIEHGQGATKSTLELMKEKGVALCPTLAAGEAISEYNGWIKGKSETPNRVIESQNSFKTALEVGVTICAGGDVGVFEHGTNVREFLLMEEYGMSRIEILKAITSGNAEIFHLEQTLGAIKVGLKADIIAVSGNPAKKLSSLEQIELVIKDGVRVK